MSLHWAIASLQCGQSACGPASTPVLSSVCGASSVPFYGLCADCHCYTCREILARERLLYVGHVFSGALFRPILSLGRSRLSVKCQKGQKYRHGIMCVMWSKGEELLFDVLNVSCWTSAYTKYYMFMVFPCTFWATPTIS